MAHRVHSQAVPPETTLIGAVRLIFVPNDCAPAVPGILSSISPRNTALPG